MLSLQTPTNSAWILKGLGADCACERYQPQVQSPPLAIQWLRLSCISGQKSKRKRATDTDGFSPRTHGLKISESVLAWSGAST